MKNQFRHKDTPKSSLRNDQISTWKKSLLTDPQARLMLLLILLAAGFLSIFLINNVISHIDISTWTYQSQRIFPDYPPVGNDFRVGYYWPAEYLISTHFSSIGPNGTYPSNYPPLVALTSLPYLLFDSMDAYLIHVGLIILANLACLGMAVSIIRQYVLDKTGLSAFSLNVISVFLFFMAAIYIFGSYFFAYSMERGNTDIFAMFFCLLALWCLIKKPNNVWLQVILLSIAVHFKIYPAVLFALLLYKHGKKLVLPALTVNLAFLFILGPRIAIAFIKSVTSEGVGAGIGNAWSNVANHAAYSFVMGIDTTSGEYLSSTFFVIWAAAFIIPLLVWGISVIALILKKYSNENAVYFFMVSVPLMNLLPTVSIDYKLVILGTVICMLLGLIIKQVTLKFSWFDLLQLIAVFLILLMINRSYALIRIDMPAIQNKYIWVLLLQLVMTVNMIRNRQPPEAMAVNKES